MQRNTVVQLALVKGDTVHLINPTTQQMHLIKYNS
jgi:hypothetical protein